MNILITESQYKKVLKEYYEKDKLYHRESLVQRLLVKNKQGFFVAPKQIRDVIEKLPYIDCYDQEGNKQTCTKIPEVLHVYLTGRY
jgi:uncharacterized protein YneF (UPF0154 family)